MMKKGIAILLLIVGVFTPSITVEATQTISEDSIPSEEETIEYTREVDVETVSELEELIEERQQHLAQAQEMLTQSRTLGYSEDGVVIKSIKREIATTKTDIVYYNQKRTSLIQKQEDEWAREYPDATYIYLYLQEMGYNKYVIAGILGNVMCEVGGGTLNLKCESSSSVYYGMCQWNRKLYSGVYGASVPEQCNYLTDTIEQEFNNYGNIYGYSYSDFLNIQDEQTAALVFAEVYERCARWSYAQRKTNATIALEYFSFD